VTRRGSSGGPGTLAAGEGVRLVVLPFNHDGPGETAYITEGITEKLTNSLADIPTIGVIARTSAMQYAGVARPPRDIGAELGVQYMIEGSLRPVMSGADSGSVALTWRLYRTSDGELVASPRELTMPPDSIFQMIGGIAENVAATLDIDVTQPQRERLAAQPTRNMRAWDYNLRGDELYNRNWTRAVVDSAIKLYDMATTLDPEFALAHAKLARAHAWMNQLRYDLSPERLERSRFAAETALRLDSLLMEAHLGFGFYQYWGLDDYDKAIAAFTRARELRPSGTGANLALVAMANVQRRQGRFDEAIANYDRARQLDPRSHIIWYNHGETLLFTHRYEEARTQLDQVTQLNRVFPEGYVQRARLALNWQGDRNAAHSFLLELGRAVPDSTWRLPVWNMLRVTDPQPERLPARLRARGTPSDTAGYHIVKANIYDGLDRMDEARVQFDSARVILERLQPSLEAQPSVHGLLGLAYAAAGRAEEAIREGERAMALLPESDDAFDGPEWRINMARILALLGRTDSAAAVLRPALDSPSWISRQWVRVDPIWTRYLDSPPFRTLLADSTPRVAAGR
jgi:serine/threonine-protein kinase